MTEGRLLRSGFLVSSVTISAQSLNRAGRLWHTVTDRTSARKPLVRFSDSHKNEVNQVKSVEKRMSLLLALVMIVGVFASAAPAVYAEETHAAYVRKLYSNEVEYFPNPTDAWNKAAENWGATFGLLEDWDGGRRVVPEGANMNIELNGHVLTRRKGGWDNDGEVIYVGKNAALTFYGGTSAHPDAGSDIAHVEKAYVAGNEDFSRKDVTFYGGLIHGGNSSNGGIHMKSGSRVNLYYVTVAGNRAEQTWNMDGYGGGVNNYNDNNTIDCCTVWDNYAGDSGGAGGGVYTECTNNITLSGSTIIRGNHSKSHDSDNMYLPGIGTSATNAFIIPALTNGADVHIRTAGNHTNQVSITGTFRDDFYSYDNDESKYIGWSESSRDLRVMGGPKPVTPHETFIPDSGKTTRTVAGGYTVDGVSYDLVKGVTDFWTNNNTEQDFTTVFYYSDGTFMGDTMKYNNHLATMSCILNGTGGNSNDGGWGEDPMMYVDKSNNFRQIMSDIGVKDEDIYVNDFYARKPENFSIGVGLGSKTLPDGCTLVIVSVRSLGYEKEWISNFTLGTEGEVFGFSSAADQVMAELAAYLDRQGIDGTSDSTKFWITGYS